MDDGNPTLLNLIHLNGYYSPLHIFAPARRSDAQFFACVRALALLARFTIPKRNKGILVVYGLVKN